MKPQHAFPNLFLVGAPRAGTTFLFDLLSQSEDIFAPRDKEPTYFHFGGHQRLLHKDKWIRNRRESRFERDYLNLYRDWTDETWAIDGSTYYLSDPDSAHRIAKCSPDAKILAVLRDPVERAFSHYRMERRDGWVVEDFEDALRRELDEMASPDAPYAGHYHFIRGSRYVAGLKSFIDVFGAENVMVLKFEELVSDSEAAVQAICRFLSIDAFAPDRSEVRRNRASVSRNRVGAWIASRYRHSSIRDYASSVMPEFVRDAGRAILMRAQPRKETDSQLGREAETLLLAHLDSELAEAEILCQNSGVIRECVAPR